MEAVVDQAFLICKSQKVYVKNYMLYH